MAASTWNSQFIGINARFLEPKLEAVRPVYRFLLARELGRLRLGHTERLASRAALAVRRIPQPLAWPHSAPPSSLPESIAVSTRPGQLQFD